MRISYTHTTLRLRIDASRQTGISHVEVTLGDAESLIKERDDLFAENTRLRTIEATARRHLRALGDRGIQRDYEEDQVSFEALGAALGVRTEDCSRPFANCCGVARKIKALLEEMFSRDKFFGEVEVFVLLPEARFLASLYGGVFVCSLPPKTAELLQLSALELRGAGALALQALWRDLDTRSPVASGEVSLEDLWAWLSRAKDDPQERLDPQQCGEAWFSRWLLKTAVGRWHQRPVAGATVRLSLLRREGTEKRFARFVLALRYGDEAFFAACVLEKGATSDDPMPAHFLAKAGEPWVT